MATGGGKADAVNDQGSGLLAGTGDGSGYGHWRQQLRQ